MAISKDYLRFPGSATVEEVLRTYRARAAQWWWLLITERDGAYRVCSFGSLLPYLTGRTPHIVHAIGDCPICSGMDPDLWMGTDALVDEALADPAVLARTVSDLPLADLAIVALESVDVDESGIEFWLSLHVRRVAGVTEDGALRGVAIVQMMKGDLGGVPDF